MAAVFLVLYVLLATYVGYSIVIIGREREWHHAYLGIAAGLLPFWPAQLFALILLADEAYNHGPQAVDFILARPIRPDGSPLHRLYVWAYRKVAGWFHG